MVEFRVNLRQLSRRQEQSGQSLVEFALVLMFVILPFMFVLVDGAFTLYTYAMVTNAAREGARAGSIYQTQHSQDTLTFDQYWAQIDGERADYVRRQTGNLLGTLVSFSQCSTPITYNPDTPVMGNPYLCVRQRS